MPFQRLVIALVLAALGAAAVAAQEPGDLWFHRTAVGSSEFIQRAAVLALPAPPSGSGAKAAPGSVAINFAVDAALQWQVQHGYLTEADVESFGPDVTVSGSSITITFHVPGGPDIVIVLSNGPFLPTDPKTRLMTVTIVRSIPIGF